jgi:ribonuclease BN (tRNA processing enzyme)
MYGTGSLDAKAFSSCALIDGTVLVDCPNGLVKRLRSDGVDFNKIKIIIQTHYHGDHDFDMPFLLREFNKNPRTEPLTVIAPAGWTERIRTLFTLALPEPFDTVFDNAKLDLTEINTDGEFSLCGYKITAFTVQHGCPAFGYRITDGKKTAAFSGDTGMCGNVKKILAAADIAFVDTSDITPFNIQQTDIHMGIDDLIKLKKNFPKCRVLPTHMGDRARERITKLEIDAPADGQVYNI